MGKDTGIEWADHTFNPWWGCDEVSPGCANCYAKAWAKRTGFEVWGKEEPRREFGDDHWQLPFTWHREAIAKGTRPLVFCASMADVFDPHPTAAKLRPRVWETIEATPRLVWILVTKRPQLAAGMVPERWMREGWPRNVWLLATAEDQRHLEERAPVILGLPVALAGLSCEPLLGPVDLEPYLGACTCSVEAEEGAGTHAASCPATRPRLGWVILGGESAGLKKVRETHVENIRAGLRACQDAGVPAFVKQLGSLAVEGEVEANVQLELVPGTTRRPSLPIVQTEHPKGGNPLEWSPDLRVREWPEPAPVAA